MADWYGGLSGGQLHLQAYEAGWDVNGNYSVVQINMWIERTSGSGKYSSYTNNSWIDYVDGGGFQSGNGTYDLRGGGSQLLLSGQAVVYHNADGTRTVGISGSFTDPHGNLGSTSAGGSLGLTTIPRATQPSVSPSSGNTDANYSVGYAGASTGFTHNLSYSLDGGSTYTSLATGLGYNGTYTWTPTSSLLPNRIDATAILKLDTYSGGTLIGTKTVSLPLHVPDAIVPVVSSVSFADAQISGPDIPTLMGGPGRYVQGWSKLIPTAASAGASGSTITGSKITVNAQTTDSGSAFGSAVGLSGAVPFSAVATDSRGRSSAPLTGTVPVTAYNFPNLASFTVTRTSDAAGTIPSPTGSYLSIVPTTSVSDLTFGGVQKNLLEYQIEIAPKATGVFTVVSAWGTTGVSGNTWTGQRVFGLYASNTEWIVRLSIRDLFGKNGYNTANTVITRSLNISSESVFMDWDEGVGIGLGKYRSQVAGLILDIKGNVAIDGGFSLSLGNRATQNGGKRVLDSDDGITYTGTVSSTWNGYGQAPVLLNTGLTVNANLPYPATAIRAGSSVIVHQVGTAYYIQNSSQASDTQPRWFDLRPYIDNTLVRQYNEANPADTTPYPPVSAWRLVSGEVMLTGLVNPLTSVSTNALWMTLPLELRPLSTVYAYAEYGGANAIRVQINTDGTVYVGGTTGYTVNYVDLSTIRYNNNPSLTRTPMVLNTASGWAPYSTTDFTPQYVADDGYGRKFWEGVVKGGGLGTNIATLASNPGLVNTTANQQHLFLSPEATGYSRMDIYPDRIYRNATPANPNGASDKMSLHHATLTDAAYSSALGVYYANGGNYGTPWAQFVIKRMPDGAIKTSGLAAATAAGNWVRIPVDYAPKYKMIFVTVGTDSPARVDVNPDGWIGFTSGAGTFVGMDDFEWMPAEAWDRAWANA